VLTYVVYNGKELWPKRWAPKCVYELGNSFREGNTLVGSGGLTKRASLRTEGRGVTPGRTPRSLPRFMRLSNSVVPGPHEAGKRVQGQMVRPE
jgi:hypothetical protein